MTDSAAAIVENKIAEGSGICQHPGCTAKATNRLRLLVWGKGHPVGSHDPLRIEIGVALCGLHAMAQKVENWKMPDMCENVTKALKALGRTEPDFDRAQLEIIKLR